MQDQDKERKPKSSRKRPKKIVLARQPDQVVYACVKGVILTGKLVIKESFRSGNMEETGEFIDPGNLGTIYAPDLTLFLDLDECVEDAKAIYSAKVREGDKYYSYLKKLEEQYP